MAIPTASEIRQYLRGYCVDSEDTFTATGTTTVGAAVVGIDSRNIEPQMRISGTGIPDDTTVLSVDSVAIEGQITISKDATVTAENLFTFSYFSEMTDNWIALRRDRRVIPYIENALGQTISQVSQITEYYSGNGGSILILNRRPIIEIIDLTYTNIPAETQTGNLLLSVELIPEEGILKSRSNFNEGSFDPIFAKGKNNVKITYSYGYVDTPNDICEAITIYVAKLMLIQIGARTGGGSLSRESYSRNFGNRGKYTDVLNMMDQDFYSIMRKYTSAVVGA